MKKDKIPLKRALMMVQHVQASCVLIMVRLLIEFRPGANPIKQFKPLAGVK